MVGAEDILGRQITMSSIFVKSITRVGANPIGEKNYFSGGIDGSSLTLDLTNKVKLPGVYFIEMQIFFGKKKNIEKSSDATAFFVLTTTLKVQDVHVGIGRTKALELSALEKVSSQRSLSSSVRGSGILSEYLHVAFSAPSSHEIIPQQSFLRLARIGSEESINYIFKNNRGIIISSRFPCSFRTFTELHFKLWSMFVRIHACSTSDCH